MPPDYWDSSVRKIGNYTEEDDEEEWTPVVRREPSAAGGSVRRFGHEEELAREREIEEAEERERERERQYRERVAFRKEQDRLSKLIASGQARHVDLDAALGR